MKLKSQLIFTSALAVVLSVANTSFVAADRAWGPAVRPAIGPADDMAPPLQPPGSNIKPGGGVMTQVSMLSERVELEVRATTPTATALVTATFNMRNLGTADEVLQVRFPLEAPHGEGDGYGRFPEVQNLAAYAGGAGLPTQVVTEPLAQDTTIFDKTSLRWASFEVSFPVQRNVVISVTYVISASQRDPDASFYYVLETGAGWRGKIGRADFVVRLPYEITPLNTYLTNAATALSARPTVRGNTLNWRRINLEPTAKDNIRLMMIAPRLWLNVLNAEAAAKAQPDDADAIRGLAKAYYTLVDSRRFPEAPMDTFAARAEAAYERALEMQPANVGYRIEYAELLRDVYFYTFEYGGTDLGIRKTHLAIDQLEAVFELDPQNALAIGIFKALEQGAQNVSQNSQTESQKKGMQAMIERLQAIKVKYGIATAMG